MDKTTMRIYPENGISIKPYPARRGDKVVIKYDGLLAKSGADQVYLHVGYGPEERWHDVQDIPMTRDEDGWSCFVVPQYNKINFCFHDSAQNWDNNKGQNWSIKTEF